MDFSLYSPGFRIYGAPAIAVAYCVLTLSPYHAFRDTWERDNAARLEALDKKAKDRLVAKDLEGAEEASQEILDLAGGRELESKRLRKFVEDARARLEGESGVGKGSGEEMQEEAVTETTGKIETQRQAKDAMRAPAEGTTKGQTEPNEVERRRSAIDLLVKGNAAFETKKYEEAMPFFREAAELGNPYAQFWLALMFERGFGCTADKARAAQLYLSAAIQGIATAQNNIALLYANGEGVRKDDAEAARWMRKAADAGYSVAQVNLAIYYMEGRGVPKDPVIAKTLLTKAVAQGDEEAKKKLDELFPDEEPYVTLVDRWLADQRDGGDGLAFWDPMARRFASSLINVQSYRLEKFYRAKRSGDGRGMIAAVQARVSSTNRGGQPIVNTWTISLFKYDDSDRWWIQSIHDKGLSQSYSDW